MKKLLQSRGLVIGVAIVLLATSATWLWARTRTPADNAVVARATRGDFTVTVTSTGELRAPKFVKISGPANAQAAEQYQFKIASIVAEGTIVKVGDVIAELDRATVAQKLADVDLATQKADAEYQSASLDSALNLSKAREDMRSAVLTLEEKKLARDQSQYEAPSVKRLAEIDYDKAMRALRQDSLDLNTKTEQAVAKMKEMSSDLEREKNKLQIVKDVMDQYTVKAPAPGMVIYLKDWDGKKKAVGSMISSWDPTIATLPDLSQMESVTYINEIDVRKIEKGQPVLLTLDADPSKKLHGTVTSVANSGEQRPNSDAKVFEVVVNIENPDTTLRPGMTTGNSVETYAIKNVLHIPVEALLSEQGIPYVYRRVGGKLTRQEVERGAMNDDEVIITRGLDQNDEVFLSAPTGKGKLPLIRLPGSKVQSGDSSIDQKPIPVPAKPDSSVGKVAPSASHS
ncbi:MAG TPA: HlyD family efflux transporter periplasmic adaptor subunit [Gemmatimonadales bacterium]|jgi:RND family efflux transporter MFP subunit|nr:HlyD family efflux transporter periplasmic adaptor subunit [Gemmatimonadales bacterium]